MFKWLKAQSVFLLIKWLCSSPPPRDECREGMCVLVTQQTCFQRRQRRAVLSLERALTVSSPTCFPARKKHSDHGSPRSGRGEDDDSIKSGVTHSKSLPWHKKANYRHIWPHQDKRTAVNLSAAFGHFVPESVMAEQLNVNVLWQWDLKLGTIRTLQPDREETLWARPLQF